jgi:hypothetical protein
MNEAEKACPNCGKGNPVSSKFCCDCGSSLNAVIGAVNLFTLVKVTPVLLPLFYLQQSNTRRTATARRRGSGESESLFVINVR